MRRHVGCGKRLLLQDFRGRERRRGVYGVVAYRISRMIQNSQAPETLPASEAQGTPRSAGILLHPTSLPGPFGAGELGDEAVGFVEFLRQAGQRLWQVLPLTPPDAEGSPYSSESAFAGSPLLVSTQRMIEAGLLEEEDARAANKEGTGYTGEPARKEALLRKAYTRWSPGEGFAEFRERNQEWLPDYALYRALKERFGGEPWNRWPEDLARREQGALEVARRELEHEIRLYEFGQYLFDQHWAEVRRIARRAGQDPGRHPDLRQPRLRRRVGESGSFSPG